MRTKVSKKKRFVTVIIASVLLLASLVFIIWKMGSLTRGFLNNDNIRANVDCTRITLFDADKEAKQIIENAAPDIELTEKLLHTINDKKEDLCIVSLKYHFYNATGKEMDNFSMNIAPVENSGCKLYAYSPLKQESKFGNDFNFSQNIIVSKKSLDEKYFTSSLPLSFEADLRYTFSYTMAGQLGEKNLKFTTVKREEEIDEYELLFEDENKSDAQSSDE